MSTHVSWAYFTGTNLNYDGTNLNYDGTNLNYHVSVADIEY